MKHLGGACAGGFQRHIQRLRLRDTAIGVPVAHDGSYHAYGTFLRQDHTGTSTERVRIILDSILESTQIDTDMCRAVTADTIETELTVGWLPVTMGPRDLG